MALPKRRHSKSRRDKRRAHWRLTRPNLVPCPDCRALRLAHRACPSCGSYAGERVMEIKQRIHRGRND